MNTQPDMLRPDGRIPYGKEIWAETKHPGIEVSTYGRVRSRRLALKTGNDKLPSRILNIKTHKLRKRKDGTRDLGYGYVCFSVPGKSYREGVERPYKLKMAAVHVMVAEAFLGPRPPDVMVEGKLSKIEVGHKDNIRTNNRVWNLFWVDHVSNSHQMVRDFRCYSQKLSTDDVATIRAWWAAGMNRDKIAEHFGVSEAHCRRIARGLCRKRF